MLQPMEDSDTYVFAHCDVTSSVYSAVCQVLKRRVDWRASSTSGDVVTGTNLILGDRNNLPFRKIGKWQWQRDNIPNVFVESVWRFRILPFAKHCDMAWITDCEWMAKAHNGFTRCACIHGSGSSDMCLIDRCLSGTASTDQLLSRIWRHLQENGTR